LVRMERWLLGWAVRSVSQCGNGCWKQLLEG